MRLIDANALKDIEYINKGNFNTVEGIREWIDNAPTVEIPVKVEITEHHTFAKPDDVSDIDFPNSKSSEDK